MNCDVIIIMNFLKKRLFNFKNNYNNCVHNLKLISVKFNLIFFNIKTLFAINDNVLINILNIKYIFKV